MNTLKLLPRWCRILGLIILIPIIGLFISNPEIAFGEEDFLGTPEGFFVLEVPAFFDQNNKSEDFILVDWQERDLSNEILLALMLLGTWLVAFSKIRGEDEFSGQLRLQSMVSAIVYNSIILLVLNFMIYDFLFLYVMTFQLFSFLLLFSLIFALKVRRFRKGLKYEE